MGAAIAAAASDEEVGVRMKGPQGNFRVEIEFLTFFVVSDDMCLNTNISSSGQLSFMITSMDQGTCCRNCENQEGKSSKECSKESLHRIVLRCSLLCRDEHVQDHLRLQPHHGAGVRERVGRRGLLRNVELTFMLLTLFLNVHTYINECLITTG